jgi:hypothetical protein
MIDEGNQVVVIPNETNSATLTSYFKTVDYSMISATEFIKYANEAVEEYRRGGIKPIQSSADLL